MVSLKLCFGRMDLLPVYVRRIVCGHWSYLLTAKSTM